MILQTNGQQNSGIAEKRGSGATNVAVNMFDTREFRPKHREINETTAAQTNNETTKNNR